MSFPWKFALGIYLPRLLSLSMSMFISELFLTLFLVDFFTLARSHKAANVQTVKVSSFSAPSDQPKLSSGAENSEAGADEWQDF